MFMEEAEFIPELGLSELQAVEAFRRAKHSAQAPQE
jgi:hypothetical protein